MHVAKFFACSSTVRVVLPAWLLVSIFFFFVFFLYEFYDLCSGDLFIVTTVML